MDNASLIPQLRLPLNETTQGLREDLSVLTSPADEAAIRDAGNSAATTLLVMKRAFVQLRAHASAEHTRLAEAQATATSDPDAEPTDQEIENDQLMRLWAELAGAFDTLAVDMVGRVQRVRGLQASALDLDI